MKNSDNIRFNYKSLGKITENKLFQAGINSLESLKDIGSEQAFIKIRKIDPQANLRLLYTLECAINNIKRDELSNKRQEELLAFFNNIKRGIKCERRSLQLNIIVANS